jgi:hypothetical protein
MELDEKQKQIALGAFNKRWSVVGSPATDYVDARALEDLLHDDISTQPVYL